MCSFKKLSSLLLASIVFFSCEDSIEPMPAGPGNPVNNTSKYSFEASGVFDLITRIPIEYNPSVILQVTYKGTGTSNMLSSVSIEASHVQPASSTSTHLESGEFQISGDEGSIYGSYTGYNLESSSTNSASWSLTVQGGTGKFNSARGNLLVNVEKSNLFSGESPFEITGEIVLPDEVN